MISQNRQINKRGLLNLVFNNIIDSVIEQKQLPQINQKIEKVALPEENKSPSKQKQKKILIKNDQDNYLKETRSKNMIRQTSKSKQQLTVKNSLFKDLSALINEEYKQYMGKDTKKTKNEKKLQIDNENQGQIFQKQQQFFQKQPQKKRVKFYGGSRKEIKKQKKSYKEFDKRNLKQGQNFSTLVSSLKFQNEYQATFLLKSKQQVFKTRNKVKNSPRNFASLNKKEHFKTEEYQRKSFQSHYHKNKRQSLPKIQSKIVYSNANNQHPHFNKQILKKKTIGYGGVTQELIKISDSNPQNFMKLSLFEEIQHHEPPRKSNISLIEKIIEDRNGMRIKHNNLKNKNLI